MRTRTLSLTVLLFGLNRLASAAPVDPANKSAKPVTPAPPSAKEQDAERIKLDALIPDCDVIAALGGGDAEGLRAEVEQVRARIAAPVPATATSNTPTLGSVSAKVQLSLTVTAKSFAAHAATLRDALKDQTKKIAEKKEQLEWSDQNAAAWTARVVELESRIDALNQLVEDAVSSPSADRATAVAALRKSTNDGVAKLGTELDAQPRPATAALVLQVEGALGPGSSGKGVRLGYQAGASFGFESRHCCGLAVYILDGGVNRLSGDPDQTTGTLGGGLEARARVWWRLWLFGRVGRASTKPDSRDQHRTGYEFQGGAYLRAIGKSPATNAFAPLVDITLSYTGWALDPMLTSGDPMGGSQYTSAVVAGVRIGADYGLDLN